jgi:pimeloyl-ACP methyl ester carboxylesterase
MNIEIQKNIILNNPETRPFLADAFYPETSGKLPLIIFCHGYKGYKDWGAWNLMAEDFAKAGFFFVKFNFSHNGTTLEQPTEFEDLEAFGNDNFTKQLSDLQFVIDFFLKDNRVDADNLTLIGHSRGGGIVTIKAAEDKRVKNLITLASVDRLDFFPKGERAENWRKEGVFYTLNGRTGQKMPHYIQLSEDFEKNITRLNIANHARGFQGKSLVIHGAKDEAVGLSAAENLQRWLWKSELLLLENANHTFGTKEPWTENILPEELGKVVEKIMNFFN